MYFPMFVSLEHKKCVVIGGGRIAVRRVQTLLNFCKDITVISPELCPEMEMLAKEQKITYCCRNYQPGDGKDAFILVAATNDREVNRQAGAEAKTSGAFVSAAMVGATVVSGMVTSATGALPQPVRSKTQRSTENTFFIEKPH